MEPGILQREEILDGMVWCALNNLAESYLLTRLAAEPSIEAAEREKH
jgi:hypothetical protein